jgi:hypothetical protein
MTTIPIRASGTTRVHPESASQTISSRLWIIFREAGRQQCRRNSKSPWHPGSNHAAINCYNLRRTFSNPSNDKKNKSTDKEPEEDDQGDKSRNAKFQDASKTINIIFEGDEEFSSRREHKLLLREIMSVKLAVPQPLRWSEVPILFSRDGQWTSFS